MVLVIPCRCTLLNIENKDTTESITSASYLDLLLLIGMDGQLHTSIYDNEMISISTSQTFRSWLAE